MREGDLDMRWLVFFPAILALLTTGVGFGAAQQRIDVQTIVKTADVNNDGHIDRVEFLRRMTEAFFFIDSNKDGFLIKSEIQQTIKGADPKRVDAADVNRNGKISMYEFHKTVDVSFDEADANRNGLLSMAEVKTRWGTPAR
jgi:Ca2+-binding EF-hand superfamily protein